MAHVCTAIGVVVGRCVGIVPGRAGGGAMAGDAAVPPTSAVADVLALRGLDGRLTPALHPVVAPTGPRRVAR